MNVENETLTVEFELREADNGHELYARIVPYNQKIMHKGRPEFFVRGAFSDLKGDIPLFTEHGHKGGNPPVGRSVSFEEREDGLYARFAFADTTAGRDAYQLVKDGTYKKLSPGFDAFTQRADGGIVKATLRESSLVSWPAYDGAVVISVRDMEHENTIVEAEPVDVSAAVQEAINPFQEEMRAAIAELRSAHDAGDPEVPAPPTAKMWFRAEVEKVLRQNGMNFRNVAGANEQYREALAEFETRALSDVTGTVGGSNDASGTIVEDFFASEAVDLLDTRRPLTARLSRVNMPQSGKYVYPIFDNSASVVGPRGTQKTEIPSGAHAVTQGNATAAWLAGGWDVALEYLESQDVEGIDDLFNTLQRFYARATEQDATLGTVAVFEANSDFNTTGAALRTDSYANFVADIIDASDDYEDGAEELPSVLAVTRTQYKAIMGLVDSAGRRIVAPTGPQNSDAQAPLLSQSFTINGTGLEIVKVKGLTAAYLFGPSAIKFADSGVRRLQALNVALAGVDIAVLGRILHAFPLATAVQKFSA